MQEGATSNSLYVFNLIDGMVMAARMVGFDNDYFWLENVLDLCFTTHPQSGQYMIIFNKRSFVFLDTVLKFPRSRVVDFSCNLMEGFEEFYEAAVYYCNQAVKVANLKELARDIMEQAEVFAQEHPKPQVTLDDTSIETLFKELSGKKGGNDKPN